MQVTFNDVRYATIEALNAAFPDIPVSDEETAQPPSFFVQLLEPTHTQELGRRYRRDHPILVRYFGSSGTEDKYAMAESLTGVLNRIAVNGRPVRGAGMRWQIVDGVLHFNVNYNFLVWSISTPDPVMALLQQEGGLKP